MAPYLPYLLLKFFRLPFLIISLKTISVSNLLIEKYGCKTGNIEQELPEGIKVYKDDVLCNPSRNSLTVHVFLGSWLNNNTFKMAHNDFFELVTGNVPNGQMRNLEAQKYYKNWNTKTISWAIPFKPKGNFKVFKKLYKNNKKSFRVLNEMEK